MCRFWGLLMQMSLVDRDVEGDKSLWYPTYHINISPTCQIELDYYPGWAGKHMQFRRLQSSEPLFIPRLLTTNLKTSVIK